MAGKKSRKNAGRGKQLMFHGAFGTRKDAASKERHVKGGFIRKTEYPTGTRWVVYSRRTNPIRRRKRKPEMVKAYAPREYGKSNPMELTVMGANPYVVESKRGWYDTFDDRERARTVAQELKREGRGGKVVHAPDMEAYRRKRGKRLSHRFHNNPPITVHPGQTITFRFNPSAETLREEFVGKPVDWITIHHEPHMVRGEYAQLGQCMGVTYKPIGGGQVQVIGWYQGADRIPLLEAAKRLLPLTEAPLLVAAKDRHLYLVGGNQDVSPICNEDTMCELGKVRHIVYRERKGLDEFREINYAHKFGHDPETGRKTKPPTLVYDRRMNRILLEGGDYGITWRGIEN